MVRRKEKFPAKGEIIIGKVKSVNPYSAFISLDEYPIEGMVHISEVARKWVKDIRTWVKEGSTVVCLVLNLDRQKGHLNLSLKRVDKRDENRRLQTWKRDGKGEKFLTTIAKDFKITQDEMYEKVGFVIQEEFKDMLDIFEVAQKEGIEILQERGIDKKWAEKISAMAKEKITIKDSKIDGYLILRTFTGDGIDIIKKVFIDAAKKYGINIIYMSAPRYELSINTKDPKKGQKSIEGAAEMIKSHIEKKWWRV